jgi:hypothetical protein
MVNAVAPLVASHTAKEEREVGERLIKSLHGVAQDAVKPPVLTRDEQLTLALFRGFREIHGCIERLRDCETYIGRFPFRRTRITRDAYLQLIVEAHLHELYMLRERLVSYVKLIQRFYRKDGNAKAISKTTASLKEYVSKSFAGFTFVRGSHVHRFRYSNDDIDRIALISLLQTSPNRRFRAAIRSLGRVAISETHNKLKAQAKNWNSLVAKVLEVYFTALLQIVFANDGKSLRYPRVSESRAKVDR